MRTPTSWNDRDLLEIDPFASTFYARQLSPPGRRGLNAWIKQFAQEIQNTPDHRAAAERWVEYAFTADGTPHSLGPPLNGIEVFVRFYWTWYSNGEEAAAKVVNDERRDRGFGYRLPAIRPLGGQAQEACITAGPERVSAPSPGPSCPRKRPQKKRQKRQTIVPAAQKTQSVSIDVEDNFTDVPHAPEAVQHTDDTDACADSGLSHVADFAREDADIEEDEGKDMLVFTGDEDLDVFMQLNFPTAPALPNSADAQPLGSKVLADTTLSPLPRATSPTLSIAGSAAPGGNSSSPFVLNVNNSASAPLPEAKRSRRKNQGSDIPVRPRRTRLPRAATNMERLSAQMQAELRYQKQAKKRRPNHIELDTSTGNETNILSGATTQDPEPARKRFKKSQAQVPSQEDPDSSVAPAETTEPVAPIQDSRRRLVAGVVAVTSEKRQAQGTSSKRGRKAQAGTGRKKLVVPGHSARPTKRQRVKDDGLNAIGILNQAMTQRQSLQGQEEMQDHPQLRIVDESAPGHRPSSAVLHGRKQIRESDGPVELQEDTYATSTKRNVGSLSKSKPTTRVLAPRVPGVAVLGTPANLQHADTVVQQAAAEASLVPRDSMTVSDGSIKVVGFQGGPPSSDDEDDIPLSTVVASKTATLAHGYAPAYSTIPQHLPARTTPKRPLSVQPIIWAQSRQEVCESFDWFRSYQGGVYFNNDMVKGYLLGKHPSSRDRFLHGGRLIISHGGGKAESVHSKHGHSELLAAEDQHENDKSIRALLRTYQMGRPLVLIIDDQYEPFPFDLASKGVSYAVLGFYHIAHAWAEREPAKTAETGFVVRYKFAFEWCEKQPPPWWLQQAPPASVPRRCAPSPAIACPRCHKPSPRVFQDEWMCLQPDCPAFWRGPDGMAASPDGPTYHPSFLDLSFRCDHEPMEDIMPLPPATEAADGVITSHRFCKGWHCKKCGRLSCRFKWEHWECRGCGAVLQVTGKIRIPQEFWCQPTPAFMHHKTSPGSGITVSPLCPYKVDDSHFGHYHIYTLPENRGRIYLILGGHFINNTANKIFQDYQNQAASGKLPFRRWPLRAHKCRGPFLTHYFSQNTGEPYQYVGGTDNTMPFAEGLASTDARNLIQERMESVMQDECGQYAFNEVLSAAYMEKQQMAFHSDAERGLGPRVASLSLGSSAYMHFRPLKKFRDDKGGSASLNVLTLFLRHGDVLIMDGAEIQEYYEHTVVPVNFRIAATARYIAPH